MDALRILLCAALLAWTSPSRAAPLARWEPHIAEASARFGIPAAWIRRVMRAESGGRLTLEGRPIVSRAGALGLMQVMPGTWADMRARYRLGPDPHDPRDNILAGTAYLRLMYDRFGYPGLFAAYNAGPARYARYLAGNGGLPRETVAYLAAVTASDVAIARPAGFTPPNAVLFALRRDGATRAAPVAPAVERVGGLFALRSRSARGP